MGSPQPKSPPNATNFNPKETLLGSQGFTRQTPNSPLLEFLGVYLYL